MKKNYFLLTVFLVFLSIGNLSAQAGLYSFSASPGTFTPNVGGTAVDAIEADDAISAALPIGFTFNMDGSDFTQFKISSNGYLTFNMTAGSSQSNNNLDFVAAGSRPLVAPMWDDLNGSGATAASYLLSGTAPNRVLTVEWLNWKWNWSSSDSVISFQVKLYEGSNKIEFVYSQGPNAINSPSASIGMSGVGSGNGSYLSLENTSIFPSVRNTGGEVSNLNTKPAEGQTYIFNPPTCTAPSGVSFSAITTTDATVSWTAPLASWYSSIEYGPAGFTPGTGMVDSTRGTTINLTGLLGNTVYDVYVFNHCNLFDSVSTSAISFQTACAPFAAPWYDGVEGQTAGSGFSTNTSIDLCWSKSTTSNPQWNAHSNNTGSGSTGPIGANSGSNYFYLETSGGITGSTSNLVTPEIDINSLTTPMLQFYTHMYGSAMGTLAVEIYDGSVWTQVYSITGQQQASDGAAWNEVNVPLTGYSDTIQIKFVGIRGTSYTSDMAIDDISVIETPTCLKPTMLMSSDVAGDSANVSWTDNNTTAPGSWQVSYGTAGFTVGSGTQILMTADSGTLSSLMGSTTYDWYVRAICGSGDTGTWSGSNSFTTLCPVDTIPYLEDFSVWPPACWDVAAPGGTISNLWIPRSGVAEANFWSVSGGTQIMQSGRIHITADARLKFDWSSNQSSFYTDSIEVQVKAVGGTWVRVWGENGSSLYSNDGAGNSTPGSYITQTINLDPITFTNKTVEVRVIAVSDWGPDFYMDNLIIEKIPTCLTPTNLMSSDVAMDSANISWTDINTTTPGSWEVSYGAPGFTAGSGTQMIFAADSGTLSSLMGSTDYDWYVRALCGGGDMSAWSGVSSFTTLCPTDSLPYLQDFSVWPPACWDVAAPGSNATNLWIGRAGGIAEANFWSVSSGTQYIQSGNIYVSADARLKFDWSSRLYTFANDSIEVQVRANGGAWTGVWGVNGSTMNSNDGAGSSSPGSFITETIILDPLTYTNTTIEVRVLAISDYGADFFLDNLIVEEIPTCTAGSGITTYNPTQTSVDVTWTPGPFDISWEVEYGASGYTPGTGTTTPSTNDSITITGLLSNTAYDFYFRGICTADTGNYVGKSSITTPAYPIVYDTTYPSNCVSYTTPIGGVTHTTSGLYFDTVQGTTPHVYDSAIHVYLATVNPTQYGLQVVAICDSLITGSGNSLTASGIYVDSLTSSDGCDSIMTIDLTITTTTYIYDTIFACDSNDFRGTMLYAAGDYSDTASSGSCDVIYLRNLTMGYATWESFTHFVCDSFVSPTGKVWNMDGTYMDTLTNASGCDSNMTFNLTFGYISYSTTTETHCDSYTSPSGIVWTTSGTYLDTIVNASGCDSAMTFNLTINYSSYPVVTLTVCDSYVRPLGAVEVISGVYIDSLLTSKGCDSVIRTNLTVNYTTSSTINPVACATYTSPSGKIWTTSALRRDTIMNSMGCDSLMTINLTINPISSETRTIASCYSYTVPETGRVYTTSGTKTDVITNAFGCPHTITTILTINTASAGVITVSGITLSSSATGVDYKWVDCDNNYSYLLKDTLSTYTPPRNGNYACWVTSPEGCSDTSNCISIQSVSLEEYVVTESDISIYPNPANDFVTIDILNQNDKEAVEVRLFDTKGKLVYTSKATSDNNKVTFDVSKLAEGVYTVTVFNEFFSTSKKVIVVK